MRIPAKHAHPRMPQISGSDTRCFCCTLGSSSRSKSTDGTDEWRIRTQRRSQQNMREEKETSDTMSLSCCQSSLWKGFFIAQKCYPFGKTSYLHVWRLFFNRHPFRGRRKKGSTQELSKRADAGVARSCLGVRRNLLISSHIPFFYTFQHELHDCRERQSCTSVCSALFANTSVFLVFFFNLASVIC